MKKKLLLIALPALMVLSGCSAVSIKPAEKVNDADLMLEDTTAHEELFGDAKLAPNKLGDPEGDPAGDDPSWTKMPKIGVQFASYEKDEANYYAVRYVAAIAGLQSGAVTAEWTRGVSDEIGNELKPLSGGKMSTVEYNSLNNNLTPTAATSEGEGYYKYIIYTLYDIPAIQVSSYVVAYLTLSKSAQTPAVSKAVAARIGGGNAFSFAASKAEGYFIQGKINGTANQILNLDDTPEVASDHAEKQNAALKEDDEFGCFYYNPGSSFKFFGYDMVTEDSGGPCDYYLEQSGSTQYIKVRANSSYTLTMSDSDSFSISDPVNPTVTLYFHPGSNWRNDKSPKYSIWYNSSWHNFTADPDSGSDVYKLEEFEFTKYYSNLVFVRYPNTDDAPNMDWSNVYDKTADQDYPRDSRPNKRLANVYDEDWNNARVSWTVLGA